MKMQAAQLASALLILTLSIGVEFAATGADSHGGLDWHDAWGAESNSLRAGLTYSGPEIRIDAGTGQLLGSCALTITNVSAGRVNFFFPPAGERDEFVVTGLQGDAVARTKVGYALGTPITNSVIHTWEANRMGYARSWLGPGEGEYYENTFGGLNTLDLGKFFCLTNPGQYKLTRFAKVCFADTNGVLRTITLPPVSMPLRVVGDRDPGKTRSP